MSAVKPDAVQLGTSTVTPANNFTLRHNNDGSGGLYRGNVGATTQDILTWDAGGLVQFPAAQLRDTVVFHTGVTTPIADGAAICLGPNGAHPTAANVEMVMPYAGYIEGFYAYAGTIGAGTRTYTLFKNNVPTALVCSSTGGVSIAAASGATVTFAHGDRLGIFLATTGGATTSFHQVSLPFTRTS